MQHCAPYATMNQDENGKREGNQTRYLLLFLEGIITFISPCLLPMLPIYLSYFAAGEPDKRHALKSATGFVAGFTAVFTLLGAFAGTVGMLLREHSALFNIVTGAVVVIFGLNFSGILNVGLLNRAYRLNTGTKIRGFFSSMLFGIVFSVGWTPCVGAFLGSALMLASQQGSALQGITMLLTFSLGLGIPFIISAVLIDRLKGVFDFIKKNYRIVNAVSGGFLIVVGILMMSGYMGRFLALLT